jgi:hypothetical protein
VRCTRGWLFRPEVVRVLVPSGQPGVYLLWSASGTCSPGTRLVYVGRSDNDLQRRLARHEKYPVATHFGWRSCSTPKEAFQTECLFWHSLAESDGILNKRHPAAPAGSGLMCPFCEAESTCAFVVAR